MEEQVQQVQANEPNFVEFVQEYPGLDAKTIPQSVWDEVKGGGSLLHAYRGHELRQLKSDNQRLQQQIDDLGRQSGGKYQSLGSMRSAGRAPQTDSFLIGFDQD